MHGKPCRFGLFFDHEQDRLTPAVRPLHEERDVEFAEALAKPFLQLLLAHRGDPGIGIDGLRLAGCEQRDRLARVIENEVLEVLVVRHALGPSVLGGMQRVTNVRKSVSAAGQGKWVSRSFRVRSVREDDAVQAVAHPGVSEHSRLAVTLSTIFHGKQRIPLQPGSRRKRNPVLGQVRGILARIELDLHAIIVRTIISLRQWVVPTPLDNPASSG